MRTSAVFMVLLLASTAAAAADEADAANAANETELRERIEQLEQRIQDLESDAAPSPDPSGGASWTRYVRLGGSGDAGYFGGQHDSLFHPGSFLVWDARLFVDAQVGDAVTLGEQTIFRNVALTFEWDLVRIGLLRNDVGELYVDFQGMLGRDALNFQAGRFQIPVGESYLRYSQGYAHRPFISNPVGGPWWWDEGVRFYGSSPDKSFGYVSSVSDGDTPFNVDSDGDKQVTLKLFWRPRPWLYLSASGLRSGELGSQAEAASGALWLGETWGRSIGSGAGVPSYQDGVEVAAGPNRLEDTWLVAGDAIVDLEDKVRLWLAYGRYTMLAKGASSYDRTLHYWIAETILRGAWASETLRPFYLGLRASALGTYDDDEGYLLDFRRGSTLGYNMESLTEYSAVLGWELNRHLRLRAEYTHGDIALVRGVTPDIRAAASKTDAFAVGVGASF